ncbi:MAG: alpha/beta hydrolase [Acidimicrobiia bacterium]
MTTRRPGRLGAFLAALVLAGACAGDDGPAKPATGAAAATTTTEAAPTTTTSPPETTTTSAAPATTAPPATTATTAPPPAPAPPSGSLAWTKCGSLQCATLRVPVDYANPGGGTLDLALARKPATSSSSRIGSLVFNPGGPGDSGIDALPHELEVLNPVLRQRFDIVSWDPRGIGRSAPIRCREAGGGGSSSGDSGPPVDPMPTNDADRQRLAAGYRAYGDLCSRVHGTYLNFVGTSGSAEDLERIRQALGDERLTFIGHSSGTLLGAIYAERYPQRVRALVLDGPIDPSLDLIGMTRAQSVAFERTIDGFFAWCAADSGCAWKPGADLRAGFLALIDRVRKEPLSAPEGEKVGVSQLMTGVMGRLYARSRWPSLSQALRAAEQGDGSPLATFSNRYVNSGASNFADARSAITCADHPAPRDPAAYPALVDAAAAEAPVFGPLFTWATMSCGLWPVPASLAPHPVKAAGAPPILVVGTTGDPATPQAWAESLANQLEQGVLVLRQGSEHVAYYYSSCVRGIVDAYLVDGRLPADPTTCKS